MPKLLSKWISLLLLCTTFFTFTASPVLASVTYLYDANGNMTSDGTNCYSYNNSNQLSQIKNCSTNQVIAQYVYDYQGNRLEKKLYTSGTLSQTVYSPDKTYETAKIASNGATQNTSYYYFRDEVIAKKNPDGTKNFYVADNLHSTSLLTSETGSVLESSSYYPFGQVRSGGTQGKYLYTGQQSDSESGLDYYVARYYNPQIRRFTQPDDVIPDVYNPQTLNRYSYVNNNPLTYTDPSGHCIGPLALACGALVLGASVVIANINPIIATVNNLAKSANDFFNHPSVKGAAGLTLDVVSNIPAVKGEATAIKAAEEVIPEAPKIVSTIYRSLDEFGNVNYIGKTVNFAQRQYQWARLGRDIQPVPGLGNVPVQDLRGVEQAMIEKYGLENLDNKINSISSKNPIYPKSLEVGNDYLRKVGL